MFFFFFSKMKKKIIKKKKKKQNFFLLEKKNPRDPADLGNLKNRQTDHVITFNFLRL